MIGTWGFLEELSFVVVPLLLLLTVVIFGRRSGGSKDGFSLKGTILLVVFILLPTVAAWRFMREVQNHLFFARLTPDHVESFTIGTQQVVDHERKALLVQALHEMQWFSSHHGGWA